MKTSQRFLLIDEATGREIYEALQREFIPTKFERVHKLIRICGEVDSLPSVAHRNDGERGFIRHDPELALRHAVRRVSVTYRDGSYHIEERTVNSNGRHDAKDK
jgi:hypothetical protein